MKCFQRTVPSVFFSKGTVWSLISCKQVKKYYSSNINPSIKNIPENTIS
jgi:hypothetical protein